LKLHQIDLPCDHGTLEVEVTGGKVLIHRTAKRGSVHNLIENYELIGADGRSRLVPLDREHADQVLDRVAKGENYSSAFIFEERPYEEVLVSMGKTDMEHSYTSTGIKFWRHFQQMYAYRSGTSDSVVSTHISPEGACNLSCPYCSVTYRDTHSRIPLEVVKQYVEDLQSRGLRAVILTGGGEPTAYKYIDDLVRWLKYDRALDVALITNGTLTNRLSMFSWKAFSWVRVSINIFDGWEERIQLPLDQLSPDCVVGASMVYTAEHEATVGVGQDRMQILRSVSGLTAKLGAKYVRLLPNCLLEGRALMLQHRALAKDIEELGDPRFFHQHKTHAAPCASTCHQAYFRPYLSEEKFKGNGQPGTVYPCDSVVLNESNQYFAGEYQVCHASQVLDFLDGRLQMKFDPRSSCKGCVFTENVDMLERWKVDGDGAFRAAPLEHENFV
jgi:hypothetical protein